MPTPRRGFVPVRSNGLEPVLRRFKVESGADNAYFVGDPVIIVSGKVAPAKTSASANIAGVISAVYRDVNGVAAPLTFNQPNQGACIVSGASGFATVNVNGNQLYAVHAVGTASAAMVGKNIGFLPAAGNARSGISQYSVDCGNCSVAADLPFKVVGFAPEERNQTGADLVSGAGLLVKVNNPFFDQSTGR